MKRLFALVATALAAVALYAATAQSGQEAVTPAQFRALTAKVTKLRTDVNATISVLATCVMGTAIPVTRYNGYVSVDQNNQTFSTTALDITDQGDTPNGFALLVNGDQACVELINGSSLKKLTAFKPLLRAAAKPTFAHTQRHR
jgi:ABC-type Fe3+-hydroxamate transport system substrate-binding protein